MAPPGVKIAAVGLIVIHGEGVKRKALLLTENKAKSWLDKRAGDQSFPMETGKSRESANQTLQRLLDQELPGLSPHLSINKECPIGHYQVVDDTWLLVFHAVSDSLVLPNTTHDKDVSDHVWVSLVDALDYDNLRRGAFEPLRDAYIGRCEVVCHDCRAPSRLPVERLR